MAQINIFGFSGAAPALSPRILKDSAAAVVVDARPGQSELRPLFDATHCATLPDTNRQTIYRMGRDTASVSEYWLSWPGVVDVVRAQDGDGVTERTYFTDGAAPKWTDNTIALAGGQPYPQATRLLSVPAPTTAITASVATAGTGSESYVGYIYTYVNDVGWESAPSPLSNLLLCKAGGTVDLTGLAAPPAGSYGIDKIRIYRTQADATGSADYFFLREIALATSSQDDARALGELLATKGWGPLPNSAHSLTSMWNGMMAALNERTILFCEPYSPYAWPASYDLQTTDMPVALAAWQQSLLVLTTGAPELVVGSSPDSLDQSRFPAVVPCRAKRGVVSFGHGAVWPSSDGLAYSGALPDAIITRGLLTERQWRELNPDSMVAGRWGRYYACSFDDGQGRRGFLIDPTNPGEGVWWLSFGWDACWYDDLQDILFILQGDEVKRFDGDDASQPLACIFESKHFLQPQPVRFGWLKVVASRYPVRIDVFSDDRAGVMHRRFSRDIQSSRMVALPSGFKSEAWQVRVESAHDVQAVRLASSPAELSGG